DKKLAMGNYMMIITDRRMKTETDGQQVVRIAREQTYRPATAILTAYPPDESDWRDTGAGSLLVKPVGTKDLVRQIEALLVSHEDEKQRQQALAGQALSSADITAPRGERKASYRFARCFWRKVLAPLRLMSDQALTAVVLRCWKPSRQKTGRP